MTPNNSLILDEFQGSKSIVQYIKADESQTLKFTKN